MNDDPHKYAVSYVRETPVLFDWDAHLVFKPAHISIHPLVPAPTHPFTGPLAGIAVYDPSRPPVHWYLEPGGQDPYLPLSKARASLYHHSSALAARLTLIFPDVSPKHTREVALILNNVHGLYVLCASIPSSDNPSMPTSTFEILELLLLSHARLISVRIKVPKLDPAGHLPSDSICARAVSKTIPQFEDRRLFDAVFMDGRSFRAPSKDDLLVLAYSGSSFPEVVSVANSWSGASNDPDHWKNYCTLFLFSFELAILTHPRGLVNTISGTVHYSIKTPHQFNLQRKISEWFKSTNTIGLATLYLGHHELIASLTDQGYLCIMDAKDVRPIFEVELGDGKATSIHLLSVPGYSGARLAYRTTEGSWHLATLSIASDAERDPLTTEPFTHISTIPPLRISSFQKLPAIPASSSFFQTAQWITPHILLAVYCPKGPVIASQASMDGTGSCPGLWAINLEMAKSPKWIEMPVSSSQHGTGLAPARTRALIQFCNEYHISTVVPPGKSLSEELVAESFNAMNPSVTKVSVYEASHQFIAESLASQVLPLTLVHVPNRPNVHEMSTSGGDNQDVYSDPWFSGMIAIIKKSGFGIIRLSTTVADMYEVLENAQNQCMDFPSAGLHYGFTTAWQVAANATVMVANLCEPDSSIDLDKIICLSPEKLLSPSFSTALKRYINDSDNNWIQNKNAELVFGHHLTNVQTSISSALDALSALTMPIQISAKQRSSVPGLVLPHAVVPLLHDILLDQQLLARAVVAVSLYMNAIATPGERDWNAKGVLARLKDLFRMPDLLVPEALPFLELSLTVPMGLLADSWASWQLADAVHKSKSWSPDQMAHIIVSAPESAVKAILNGLDERVWPGDILHALNNVVKYSVQHQRDQLIQNVDLMLHSVFDRLASEPSNPPSPSPAMDMDDSVCTQADLQSPSTLQRECTTWYISEIESSPILELPKIVVIEAIATILMDRQLYVGAGRFIRGIATAFQNTIQLKLIAHPDELAQLNSQLEQYIIMGFHAAVKTKDLPNAIQSLNQYIKTINNHHENVPPQRGKILAQVAVLVDVMTPKDINLLETSSPLAGYLASCLSDRLIGIHQHHQNHPKPRHGVSNGQTRILNMLASVFAYQLNDVCEAAVLSYKVAICEWKAACTLVSPRASNEDARDFRSPAGALVSLNVLNRISECAQLTLDALSNTIQYLDMMHEHYKKCMQFVLLPHGYQQDLQSTKNSLDIQQQHVVSMFEIRRQYDELETALLLHNSYGDSSSLIDMVRMGMPVNNGLVVCKDYTRIPNLVLKLKPKTDQDMTEPFYHDLICKYGKLVRQDTGIDIDEWIRG